MAHRDDREALRARNVALERELADVREELERARAEKSAPPRPSRLVVWTAAAIGRLVALAESVSPRPALARWGRGRAIAFGALVAALIAGTALAIMSVITILDGPGPEEGPLEVAFWTLMVWVFVGPGSVAWLVARALRAPASAGGAGVAAGVAAFAVAIAPAFVPALQDVPRVVLSGTASGTIEEVSDQPAAAWARLEPAFVLHTALGAGVASSTDSQGRTTTHATWCAPIVPSLPWSGPVTFFACGDRDELAAGPGPGFVQGRLAPAGMIETEALGELESQGIVLDGAPRVVRATIGGAQTSFALGLLGLVLLIGLGSVGGAIVALRAATIPST